jgi:hypothetical protein
VRPWLRSGAAGVGQPARAKQKTALLPAPFWCTYRVESAHFDWRWRERPALALQAWEAVARDPLTRLYRIQGESIGTAIDFRSAAITNRDIATEAVGSIKVAEATIAAMQKALKKAGVESSSGMVTKPDPC